MSLAQAERDAEQLLDSSWGTSLPVDPFELARSLGIEVRFVWLPPDVSGRITIQPHGAAVIELNSWDHPNRQRFTCAHEIAHYLRRKKRGFRGKTFVDYRDTLAGLGIDSEEIYANQFAAALLMPAKLVRRQYRQQRSAETLASVFRTSEQAMRLRLKTLRVP